MAVESVAPSSAEPRYKYAKPSPRSMPGKPAHRSSEGSTLSAHIKDYKLPAIDVDVSLRNFPGYTESQPYSLDDIRMGDISGTTETDSKTDPKGSGGYTRINSRAKPAKPGTRR
jgi:hypothetical protein